MKKTIRNLLALSTTLLLAACNGGGDNGSPIYTDFFAARVQAREAAILLSSNPIFNEVHCEYNYQRNEEHKGVDAEVSTGQYLIESDFDDQVVVHAYSKREDEQTYVSTPDDNMTMVDEFEYYLVYDEERGVIVYYENFSEKEKYYDVLYTTEAVNLELEDMKESEYDALIGRDVTAEDAAAAIMVSYISNNVYTGEGFAFGYDVYPIAGVSSEEALGEVVSSEYEVNFDQHDLSYSYTLDESDDDETCTLTYAGVFKNNMFTSGLFERKMTAISGEETYVDNAKEEATLTWNENTIVLPDFSSFPLYN